MEFTATINEAGELIIPDEVMQECGFSDKVIMRVKSGQIILSKPQQSKNNIVKKKKI